jgi:hypothetical protein
MLELNRVGFRLIRIPPGLYFRLIAAQTSAHFAVGGNNLTVADFPSHGLPPHSAPVIPLPSAIV